MPPASFPHLGRLEITSERDDGTVANRLIPRTSSCEPLIKVPFLNANRRSINCQKLLPPPRKILGDVFLTRSPESL